MWDMPLLTLSHQISSRSSCWSSMEENGKNSIAKRYFLFFEKILLPKIQKLNYYFYININIFLNLY